MCFNCGCHIPQDDMGNPDNITEGSLKKLATNSNMSPEQLKADLKNDFSKVEKATQVCLPSGNFNNNPCLTFRPTFPKSFRINTKGFFDSPVFSNFFGGDQTY